MLFVFHYSVIKLKYTDTEIKENGLFQTKSIFAKVLKLINNMNIAE